MVRGLVQLLGVPYSVLYKKPFHESILLFQTWDWYFMYESTAVGLNLKHSSLCQQAGSNIIFHRQWKQNSSELETWQKGEAAAVQPKIRGPKLPCSEMLFAENTVSTCKYIWPQCAGHVKHPIIKVKQILMAAIQCKRKLWSRLPSWHKTNLDGVIERNVHWTRGIKWCHSNPVFVGGHVEAKLAGFK